MHAINAACSVGGVAWVFDKRMPLGEWWGRATVFDARVDGQWTAAPTSAAERQRKVQWEKLPRRKRVWSRGRGRAVDRQVRSRRELAAAVVAFNAVNIDAVCLRAKWQHHRLSHTPYHSLSLTGMSRSAKNTTTTTKKLSTVKLHCVKCIRVLVHGHVFKAGLHSHHLDEKFWGHIHAPFKRCSG